MKRARKEQRGVYQLHCPKQKKKEGETELHCLVLWCQKYQYWQQFPSMFRWGGKCHRENYHGNGPCWFTLRAFARLVAKARITYTCICSSTEVHGLGWSFSSYMQMQREENQAQEAAGGLETEGAAYIDAFLAFAANTRSVQFYCCSQR